MHHCLGCGALNLDLVYEVESLADLRVPGLVMKPGGEVSGTHREAAALLARLRRIGRPRAECGGGSAANTVCALSRLGWRTAFCGVVGEERAGDVILRSMDRVDHSLVRRIGQSALCLVVLEARGRNRAMFVVPHDRESDVAGPEVLRRLHDVLVLHMSSLVSAEGLLAQQRLADALRPEQVLSLDPGEIYARRGLEALRPVLRRVDILLLTGEEVEMLTGAGWEEGAERLRAVLDEAGEGRALPPGRMFAEAGGRVVVCKRGPLGASFRSALLAFDCPAQPVAEVVDNTGAGDAFNAGFLHTFLEGRGGEEAVRNGGALAARSLSGYGRDWL